MQIYSRKPPFFPSVVPRLTLLAHASSAEFHHKHSSHSSHRFPRFSCSLHPLRSNAWGMHITMSKPCSRHSISIQKTPCPENAISISYSIAKRTNMPDRQSPNNSGAQDGEGGEESFSLLKPYYSLGRSYGFTPKYCDSYCM